MPDLKNLITNDQIQPVLDDLEVFYRYVEKNKPVLTAANGYLGKKACFELNSLLSFPKAVEKATSNMPYYPTVNFWFHISQALGLTEIGIKENGKDYLSPAGMYKRYSRLNVDERYIAILQAFWCETDWEELFEGLFVNSDLSSVEKRARGLAELSDLPNDEIIESSPDSLFGPSLPAWMQQAEGNFLHALAVLGFWDIEMMPIRKNDPWKQLVRLKELQMKPAGRVISRALLERPWEKYNQWSPDLDPTTESTEYVFTAAFQECFAEEIRAERIEEYFRESTEGEQEEAYLFKVSLPGRIWRRILVPANATLQSLHEIIQEAFNFADDHLYAFFMDNKAWSLKGNVYWAPGNDEGPFADLVILADLGLKEKQKFIYLFDFGDEWCFSVMLEKKSEQKVARPFVLEGKGQADQYGYEDAW